MRFGFVIPQGDIYSIPEMAAEAEAAGWDGVFIPDCICIDTPEMPPGPGYDPWIVLAPAAIRTQRVRLGTMLTALPRRCPWKLARECVTLDQLSRGRLILPVGIGAAQDDAGFYRVGEVMDRKARTAMMDEGLELLSGLWRGEPVTFHGAHYHVDGMTLLPLPVQQPRIPLWVVGAWRRERSLRRALRFDGIIPQRLDGGSGPMTPDEIAALRAYVGEHRPDASSFDIILEGTTPGENPERAREVVRPYEGAGVTWWMEALWSTPDDASVRARIRQGPPRSALLRARRESE